MNITCQLLGGLGNMLFGLATTYAVSIDYNLNPSLYLNHKGYLHTKPENYLNNIFRNFKIIENIDDYLVFNETTFSYNQINIPSDKNILLFGYFQSEKYFLKHRNKLLSLFSPTLSILDYINLNFKNLLSLNTVSLHIRRGNYLGVSHIHPPCDLDYYHKSINKFKNHVFLIFSDDMKYCKENFVGNQFYFIENQTDIIDFYLMSMCKHNIIANSTFSWWAAWLNNNNNKTVIYPSVWFGENMYDTKDLCPDTWIKI